MDDIIDDIMDLAIPPTSHCKSPFYSIEGYHPQMVEIFRLVKKMIYTDPVVNGGSGS